MLLPVPVGSWSISWPQLWGSHRNGTSRVWTPSCKLESPSSPVLEKHSSSYAAHRSMVRCAALITGTMSLHVTSLPGPAFAMNVYFHHLQKILATECATTYTQAALAPAHLDDLKAPDPSYAEH